MAVTTSSSVPTHTPRLALAVAVVLGALFAATLSLWAWYGTEVFFETVRNGWLACF